jgi:hypothetical protein
MTTIPSYASAWQKTPLSVSTYEWLRNYLGLMPLRVNCWRHCWMSDAAWTEWKNYSRPRFNYVAWLPARIPFCVFKSTTLGTRSLFASGSQQSEMSIRVQKSVRRLRISKSLTCDDLSVRLSDNSGHVMTPSKPFACGYAVSETFGKTSWPSSEFGSGRPPWIDDDYQPPAGKTRWDNLQVDIVKDIRNFLEWRASQ